MSKRGLWPTAVIVLLVACSSSNNTGGPSGGGGGGNPNSVTVSIPLTDYGGNQTPQFTPVQATIPVGGRVNWNNQDSVGHTTTSDNNLWNGNLGPGGSYSRVFDTAGTYSYSCSVHSGMNGRVVVQ
jgi:plastocyanin